MGREDESQNEGWEESRGRGEKQVAPLDTSNSYEINICCAPGLISPATSLWLPSLGHSTTT